MTNDLQAARERVRRQFEGESAEDVYNACAGDAYFHDLPKDLHCIARAYLSLFDETPITEEFAIEVTQRYPILERDEYPFNAITTMGQLRCLLLAMGVK